MKIYLSLPRLINYIAISILLLLLWSNQLQAQCSGLGSLTLNVVAKPMPTLNAPAQLCTGASGIVAVNEIFDNYIWNTGDASQSITISNPGVYTVTVTNGPGCSNTAIAVISPLPAPVANITPGAYVCNGNIALHAGIGFTSYSWSNGGSNPTILVNTSGNYTVTITNAQGCTATDTYVVDIPALPAVYITGDSVICPGNSTILSSTPGYSSYLWSTTETTPNINVSAAGNYTVTVTDAFGCTATDALSVAALNFSQPNISGPAQICIGDSATFSVPGAFTNYVWSTGDTSATITVNTADSYTVTVTAANGCAGADTQTLAVVANLQPQITELPYTCNGQITLDAGTGFVSYSWDGGQNTQSIIVTNNSSYTVTVSDASGCTGTAIAMATIPPPPVVTITGNNAICTGASTTLSASAGLNAYLWNTGDTSVNISTNLAGAYTVTATDVQGCTATHEFIVNALHDPAPVISGPAQICAGSSAAFSVSGAFTSYVWSTGASTPAIMVDMADSYTVTVTDANGCTGTTSQQLLVATNPQTQITELPYVCDGQITLDAGTGFASYSWDGGQNTQSIAVTTANSYTVTVSNASGCTGTAVAITTVPPLPIVEISGNNTICTGASTSFSASAGLNAYLWNTGETGANITANTAGTYTVTATDGLGCTATNSIFLNITTPPQPVISGPDVVCTNSGGSTLTVNGAYALYNWSTGDNTPGIAITIGGIYIVTVTDANGCTGTDTQLVTEATAPMPAVTQLPYTCDGTQTLDAGAGFSSYSWSDGQSTSSVSVNTAGTYSVTVTDAVGCTGTGSLAVSIPIVPQVAITGNPVFCQNSTTTLEATAGFASYLWSTGQTSSSVTLNQGGAVTVTVTDNIGCTATETINLTLQTLPQPQIAGPSAICANASATLTTSANYTAYAWSNSTSGASITTNTPGNYTVTVTDLNGCTGTDDFLLIVNQNPVPVLSQAAYACDGQIALSANAGFDVYAWSGPNGFTGNGQQLSVTSSGIYTLTVSDNNSCSGTATVQINVPVQPGLSISGIQEACQGQSVALTASGGFVGYLWSSGQNSAVITVDQFTTYTVTATDAEGCTASASFTLSLGAGPVPVISPLPYACNSQITLNAGAGFATYNWSNGSAAPSTSITQSGTYTVTVTDLGGCTGTASIQTTIPLNPVATISGTTLFCPGSSTTLSASSGFSAYIWSTGSNLPTANIVAAGIYTVTVTNIDGCTATASVQVTSFAPTTVSIGGGATFCGAGSATLVASGSAGAYNWSNGFIGASITVTQFGTYTVTVTNPNGCTATGAVTVSAGSPVTTAFQRSTCILEEAGIETLMFTTANGCDSIVTTTTTYQPKPGLALDLEPVVEAKIGQLVELLISGNFQIDSVVFETPFALSCFNCLNPTFVATVAGLVHVTAFDVDGCSASGQLQLRVSRKLDIFVPNTFEPGSNQNGFFTVFSGPEIKSVRNFNVFDRWGNSLFSRTDMPTNDPTAGWDGSFRNQKMQPGVYVYYFEVLLADGSTELFSGDVTILK